MKYLLLLSLLFLGSCTRIAYTEKVKDELAGLGVRPSQLQFYLSNKVAMNTTKEEKSKELIKGEVEIRNTITRERIVFGNFIFTELSGICSKFSDQNFYVQFEQGDPTDKALQFALDPLTGRYTLALNTDGNLYYDRAWYKVEMGKKAYLTISKTAYTKYQLKTRRIKGMRVGE